MERRLMIVVGIILLAGAAYFGYQRFAGSQDNVRVQSTATYALSKKIELNKID